MLGVARGRARGESRLRRAAPSAAAETSLNVRAAYLEVLGDALSSVGVVVAAAMIVMTGWTLGRSAGERRASRSSSCPARGGSCGRRSTCCSRERRPTSNLGEIEDAMRSVPGVRRMHDLHVWTLTSGREAMSAHVVVRRRPGAASDCWRRSTLSLHARFGIDHTTIQLETEPPAVLRIQGPSSA